MACRKNFNPEIFSSWKIKKEFVCGIRTHDLTRISLKSYPLGHRSLYEGKLVALKKNQYPKYGKISLNT